MIRKAYAIVYATALVLLVLVLRQQSTASGPSEPPAADESGPASIETWINRLAGTSFRDREQATRALIQAGSAAIPAVLEAAYSDDADLKSRSRHILRAIADSPHADVARQAELALRLIRDWPDVAGARRSFESLTATPDALDLGRFVQDATLDIAQTKVRDEHLAQLASPGFRKITRIEAMGTQLTDAALVHLHGLPLEHLGLHSTRVTDDGLMHLKELPLKSLSLGYTVITDEGLGHLSQLPLESLMLAHTRISDQGLARLNRLPLKELNLLGANVSDAGLRHLRGLRLKQLSLSGRKVSDAGLENLRGMPLQLLYLGDTQVSDAGLEHLTPLPLQVLWLHGTGVTDGGIPRLRQIATLESLYVQNTAITEKGADKLRKTIAHVYTGQTPPTYIKRFSMIVRISHAGIKRAEAQEDKDALGGANRTIAELIRLQAKPKVIEFGGNPGNIGLPFYSSEIERFQRDEEGYSGKMTFDCYK